VCTASGARDPAAVKQIGDLANFATEIFEGQYSLFPMPRRRLTGGSVSSATSGPLVTVHADLIAQANKSHERILSAKARIAELKRQVPQMQDRMRRSANLVTTQIDRTRPRKRSERNLDGRAR